ncbi:winged helix-turn-helix transcriptional regulator [Zhouia sp. PK063]|uniref:winged helix-turn-helix transcriptional regulator n=1 Tax=Zhouia sp. PK063 TaxID=3373602 RepID=UPI003790DEF0
MGKNVKINGKIYACTISLAMDIIGGKWKTVILHHLKDRDKRYNELRKEIPAITEMTLSLQLKQLEESGLVARMVYGEKPPIKVVYSLTEFGKTFLPALEAIDQWGNYVAEEKGEVAIND